MPLFRILQNLPKFYPFGPIRPQCDRKMIFLFLNVIRGAPSNVIDYCKPFQYIFLLGPRVIFDQKMCEKDTAKDAYLFSPIIN